ncbi:metalloregulator ArsR/SmtB family transcription factor [Shewanella intestini]|uniref:Metalloregulator ArsR/SmtB family transcription factor n=1 Tax=Shewanella intestini TaxID=2017544 RepID=A0ABS5I116_9GAMM|nr:MULTISPECIES: metalloregulator ArsR/SmtB family transcription factor [Shewanella]MBR9727712.1 metalloregulator ArsR/SmtB family transcription factor [Shewanella intestini]MRG35138.1 metalloregulator ArsR/SmtB family transcription factor [Shewanella sp. XMDDZSB0408]
MNSPLAFYKSLADETRLLSILLIVKENELCVCELMQALQESQPKISRHLAQLRKVGLLQDRRQGQWVFYQINATLPQWMKQVLQDSYDNNHAYMAICESRLAQMGDRPARANKCC